MNLTIEFDDNNGGRSKLEEIERKDVGGTDLVTVHEFDPQGEKVGLIQVHGGAAEKESYNSNGDIVKVYASFNDQGCVEQISDGGQVMTDLYRDNGLVVALKQFSSKPGSNVKNTDGDYSPGSAAPA